MNDTTASPPPTEFKLASYNIRKAIGTDRSRDPMRIIRVLAEVDADIVILQEADRRFGQRDSALPAFLIDSHSGYKPVPLDVQLDSMGWHGNAILVRSDIGIDDHDIVHIPHLEPRGAVTATLDFAGRDHAAPGRTGRKLSVFGMHLDLSGLWRARQARAISELARERMAEHPVVLAGDLNEWRSGSTCFREFSRQFAILDCGRSFHSRRPVAKLDRIMHSDRLQMLECGVHHSSLASRASDHLPVWARFRFTAGEAFSG